MRDVFVGLFVDDVYLFIVKNCVHPLSQNMPIERSAFFLRSGKMCEYRASMGRVSRESRAVWE